MAWTTNEVDDRLDEAALTLRRLPHPPGTGPKGYGSSWPEYIHEAKHAYGYHDAHMKVVPNAQEIQRMEDAIGWLRFIPDPDDRRLVWMRAEGKRWRSITRAIGVSRSTAWRRWTAALLTISNHLNKNKKARKREVQSSAARMDITNETDSGGVGDG